VDVGHDELGRAVILYLGFSRASWPQHDDAAVVREFGERAPALMEKVARLRDEMGGMPVDWSSHTLASATDMARGEMKDRHPELSEAALDALAWEFSYNWK
jgi:hypothetical protein